MYQFVLQHFRRLMVGAGIGVVLSIPACSYQYGIGIKCSESLSDCQIYTGVKDESPQPLE